MAEMYYFKERKERYVLGTILIDLPYLQKSCMGKENLRTELFVLNNGEVMNFETVAEYARLGKIKGVPYNFASEYIVSGSDCIDFYNRFGDRSLGFCYKVVPAKLVGSIVITVAGWASDYAYIQTTVSARTFAEKVAKDLKNRLDIERYGDTCFKHTLSSLMETQVFSDIFRMKCFGKLPLTDEHFIAYLSEVPISLLRAYSRCCKYEHSVIKVEYAFPRLHNAVCVVRYYLYPNGKTEYTISVKKNDRLVSNKSKYYKNKNVQNLSSTVRAQSNEFNSAISRLSLLERLRDKSYTRKIFLDGNLNVGDCDASIIIYGKPCN